jgi:putative PIG3 family NAD(P)H quinone oxidoreductase
MKAVLINEETKQLYLGNWEEPVLGADDLIIKVQATAINRADVIQKYGKYPAPKGASPILGLEMAGVVEEIGENVSGWKIGDRIFSLLAGGGYAEKVSIPAKMAMKIPNNFSFEEAAAIPEVFLTAYLNLFDLGNLKPAETVLIHAGASGVGTAAIQLVKAIGATSIVTVGTKEKAEACLDLGANYVINYKEQAFDEEVNNITHGKGVNLILDFVGASYYQKNLNSISNDGKIILIATLGGSKIQDFNIAPLMFRRIQLIGSTLRSLSKERKIELTEHFSKFAIPLFENGSLKPVIDSIYSFDEVNKAHERMENNLNIGKLVLSMNK